LKDIEHSGARIAELINESHFDSHRKMPGRAKLKIQENLLSNFKKIIDLEILRAHEMMGGFQALVPNDKSHWGVKWVTNERGQGAVRNRNFLKNSGVRLPKAVPQADGLVQALERADYDAVVLYVDKDETLTVVSQPIDPKQVKMLVDLVEKNVFVNVVTGGTLEHGENVIGPVEKAIKTRLGTKKLKYFRYYFISGGGVVTWSNKGNRKIKYSSTFFTSIERKLIFQAYATAFMEEAHLTYPEINPIPFLEKVKKATTAFKVQEIFRLFMESGNNREILGTVALNNGNKRMLTIELANSSLEHANPAIQTMKFMTAVNNRVIELLGNKIKTHAVAHYGPTFISHLVSDKKTVVTTFNKELEGSGYKKPLTIGIGDSPIDYSFLKKCDYSYLVGKPRPDTPEPEGTIFWPSLNWRGARQIFSIINKHVEVLNSPASPAGARVAETPKRDLQARYDEALKILTRYGQKHVLEFWEELGQKQREELMDQIEQVPWAEVAALKTGLIDHPHANELNLSNAKPVEIVPANRPVAAKAVEALLRAGAAEDKSEFAAILVAGGSSARFREYFPFAKGLFPLDPGTGKLAHEGVTALPLSDETLYEFFVKKLGAFSRRYGHTKIYPLIIMTSDVTDAETRAYFEANEWFGMRDRIKIIPQKAYPLIDKKTGKVLMEAKHKIALQGGGHADAFDDVLQRPDIKKWLGQFGVHTVLYANIDNPSYPLDVHWIGEHAIFVDQVRKGEVKIPHGFAIMSEGMIPKNIPTLSELLRVNQIRTPVHYSKVPDEIRAMTNYGMPSYRLIELPLDGTLPAPFSVVSKKWRNWKEESVEVWKFERLSDEKPSEGIAYPFDFQTFASIKNPPGEKESPLTSVRMQSDHWAGLLRDSGYQIDVADHLLFQLPPQVAWMNPQELNLQLASIHQSLWGPLPKKLEAKFDDRPVIGYRIHDDWSWEPVFVSNSEKGAQGFDSVGARLVNPVLKSVQVSIVLTRSLLPEHIQISSLDFTPSELSFFTVQGKRVREENITGARLSIERQNGVEVFRFKGEKDRMILVLENGQSALLDVSHETVTVLERQLSTDLKQNKDEALSKALSIRSAQDAFAKKYQSSALITSHVKLYDLSSLEVLKADETRLRFYLQDFLSGLASTLSDKEVIHFISKDSSLVDEAFKVLRALSLKHENQFIRELSPEEKALPGILISSQSDYDALKNDAVRYKALQNEGILTSNTQILLHEDLLKDNAVALLPHQSISVLSGLIASRAYAQAAELLGDLLQHKQEVNAEIMEQLANRRLSWISRLIEPARITWENLKAALFAARYAQTAA